MKLEIRAICNKCKNDIGLFYSGQAQEIDINSKIKENTKKLDSLVCSECNNKSFEISTAQY